MRSVVTVCILLLCIQLQAQNKIFTGFYISNSGDTVKGHFPKYTQWAQNRVRVDFISANNSTIQLTPFNCFKFSIDNYDEYISYSGKRLINPIEDNTAIDNRGYFDFHDRDTITTIFLRLVTRTPKCEIYVLTDNIRTNFFYKLPGQQIQELKFKMYYDENNLHELPEYRQQLNNLFAEEIPEKNLSKKLEELPYTEEAISEFIEKLFSIKNAKSISKDKSAGWRIIAGVSINSFKVAGNKYYPEAQLKYSTTAAPFLSIGYLTPFLRNFSRYFFYPQIRLYNYKNSGEKMDATFKQQVTFQTSFVVIPQLNAGANIINKENYHLFLYAGVGTMFLAKNKEISKELYPSNNAVYTTYEYQLAKQTFAMNLSAGISLKNKFQFLVTYNLPYDVGKFPSHFPKPSSIQIGLGYQLKK